MKQYLILAAFSAFVACSDKEPAPSPTDAARIEGRWKAMVPANPEWHYDFNHGILHQELRQFGVVVTAQDYVYATRGDTLFIAGSGGTRDWVLYFECEDVVHVNDIGSNPLVQVSYLRRE